MKHKQSDKEQTSTRPCTSVQARNVVGKRYINLHVYIISTHATREVYRSTMAPEPGPKNSRSTTAAGQS